MKILPVLALVLSLSVSQAQSQWSGAGGTNDWSEAGNWLGGAVPVGGIDATVTFGGATRLVPNQNFGAPFVLNTLTFASDAGAFRLQGDGLDFRDSSIADRPRLTNDSGADVAIESSIKVDTDWLIDGTGAGTLTLGPISGAGSVSNQGVGKLILRGANTFSGATANFGGVLQIGDGGAGTSLASDNVYNYFNGTLIFDTADALQIKQLAAQGGVVRKVGANTLSVGYASLSGSTIIEGGVFEVGEGIISGGVSGDGALRLAGPGTLAMIGANSFKGGFSVSGGRVLALDDAALGQAGGAVTIEGGGVVEILGDSTTTRQFAMADGTLEVGDGVRYRYNGATVEGGTLGGAGVHEIGGGSTFSDITLAAGSKIEQVSGAATLRDAMIAGDVEQAAGATMEFERVVVVSTGRVGIGGTVNATAMDSEGTVVIESGGELNIAPGGSLLLFGGSVVNNGTLMGRLGTVVGSTVKGSGSFGDLFLENGGTFAPGNSVGLATAVGATFLRDSRFEFELNSTVLDPGVHQDLLSLSGGLQIASDVDAPLTISLVTLDASNAPGLLTDFDATQSYRFLLIATSQIYDFDPAKFLVDTTGFLNPLEGGSFSVGADGSGLYLDYTAAVPEPGSVSLFAVGFGAVLVFRRRVRSG